MTLTLAFFIESLRFSNVSKWPIIIIKPACSFKACSKTLSLDVMTISPLCTSLSRVGAISTSPLASK